MLSPLPFKRWFQDRKRNRPEATNLAREQGQMTAAEHRANWSGDQAGTRGKDTELGFFFILKYLMKTSLINTTSQKEAQVIF